MLRFKIVSTNPSSCEPPGVTLVSWETSGWACQNALQTVDPHGHKCIQRVRRCPFLLCSTQDMALPLGRNHAPPEALLRQGAESGWAPQPDCLKRLAYYASSSFGRNGWVPQKFNAGASPGLDGSSIPFLKYACLHVEHGRKVDYVDMLVPLIARMFSVFLCKARIPAYWKVAKLSALHKKGAMSNPGFFRMIAVSGLMHRIYAKSAERLGGRLVCSKQ
eukprot:1151925-Pelagomonas_calceolata.AAC.3